MDFSAAFNLFAMEQEGLLDTEESLYHRVDKLITQGYSVAEAADEAGVNLEDLTQNHIAELFAHSGEEMY